MRLLLPLILALATCWASDPLLESVPPQPIQAVPGDYRLSLDVTPTKYEIDLVPVLDVGDDSKSFRFDGHSKIALDVKISTDIIVLHSRNLIIHEEKSYLTYTKENKPERINITTITYDNTKEFAIMKLKEPIPQNVKDVQLFLEYNGTLNDDLRGFYRSSYQDEQNKTRWLATTHFEPTGARQAFPCWDEPAIKATFKIKIKPPIDYHVLSNTMNTTDKDGNGYVPFPETPKMSTYLVAFVVSDFAKTENKENDRKLRVWSKPTPQGNYREFALQFGQKALKQLEDFTGSKYFEGSIKKMDQIAIPQFSAGAMENWGLVTYRESSLLYNKDVDTTETKQNIATTIAHEFAHQWFGNKVTCNWWSSIWLNEGFATFFQYYIPDQIEEKEDGVKDNWRLMEQFVTRALQATAFVVDANSDTRALTVDDNSIQTPQQISSLFDSIAYQKGGCILRMMQQFLTEKSFKSGLQKYVKDYVSESVVPENLFTAIESQKDTISKLLPENTKLNEVMKQWVYKPGYPVVTVKRNDTDIILTQERFLLDPQQDDTKWYIPITYFTENLTSNEKTLWLKPTDNLSLKVDELIKENGKDKWILFNNHQTGYYRVNYDDASWNRLAKYLESPYYQNISAISRSQLIDDASNLARAGHTSYNNSLSITLYLRKETDYIPWYASYRAFDVLYNLLWGTKSHDKLISYVAKIAEAFVKEHDYKQQNGTHVERLAKVLALKLAHKYKVNGDHVTYAENKLQNWLINNTKIWPEIKNEVLCAGLQDANETTVEKILNKYNTAQGNERTAILKGLGCNTNEKNINHLLATSINKTSTIKVDVFDAMSSVHSGNPGSFDILIKFIKENIEEIKKADKTETSFAAILNNLATRVKTDAQFFTLASLAHTHLKADQKIKTVNSALNNLNVIKSYLDEASAWLEEEAMKPEPTSPPTPSPDSASSITLTSIFIIIPVFLARFN